MNTKAVLLVEFKFHQEILPSQIKFLLSGGFDVHVFLDEELWDDALFSCFKDKIKVTRITKTWKWFNKVKLYFNIKRYVRDNNISHLVVNTLDSKFGSFIINGLPQLNKVGIAHRVHDIANHKAFENNVRQMNAVLTLSVKTQEYMIKHFPWVKEPLWFYPIFFCENQTQRVSTGSSQISIVIPGQISHERRDYYSLIEAARHLSQRNIDIKFKLLGNAQEFDGPLLQKQIESSGLAKYFSIWNGFVPYLTFMEEISSSDYVMPLLSPDRANSENYKGSQISAAINWALGYRKKLLLHEHFGDLDFLSSNATLYNSTNMPEVLTSLSKTMPGEFKEIEALSFENVRDNYLKVFSKKYPG